MKKLTNYLSLVKFSHTIFALPFALTGFFLGVRGISDFQGDDKSVWTSSVDYLSKNYDLFVYVLLCMVFARSAAMAFNRYLDREFDAINPRTAIREIPRGVISPAAALRFTILNSVLFTVAAGMINITCLYLSPVALLVVLGYSYTKRFTPLCHLVLGVGLALAPVGAFIAVTEQANAGIIVLSIAVACWVSGFDIIYALQDEQFDKTQGLKSIPTLLGPAYSLLVSKVLHIITSVCIITSGMLFDMHWLYFTGSALFALMLIWQHKLVKPNDLSKVNMAFMTTNGLASIFFSIAAVLDLFLLN
jgi:4-hydroxybenzoate polyprenyltransferase